MTRLRSYLNQSDDTAVAELDHLMGLGILQYCDPPHDIAFAEKNGRIAGYARAWQHARDDVMRFTLEVSLRDDATNEDERALLEWLYARVADMRKLLPVGGGHVSEFFVPERRSGLLGLLRADGFEIARTDLSLTRTLDDAIAELPLAPGIELRPVTWHHGAQLINLVHTVFDMPMRDANAHVSRNEFEQWLAGAPATATASISAWSQFDNAPVCVVLSQIDPVTGRACLSHICTHKDWRRRGLAGALITRSLRNFQASGVHEAVVEVNDFNTDAWRLYEALGFSVNMRLFLLTRQEG